MSTLRVPKRRDDWRLGRFTAKSLLLSVGAQDDSNEPHDLERFAAITIAADEDGAPVPSVNGTPAAHSLSMSHSAGRALAAVGPSGIALGCDIEVIEPRPESFARDYLTASELAMVDACEPSDRTLAVTVLWSAKESALKALRVGLRANTRSVDVDVEMAPVGAPEGWRSLNVRASDAEAIQTLEGWWRRERDHVLTVVADEPTRPPVEPA